VKPALILRMASVLSLLHYILHTGGVFAQEGCNVFALYESGDLEDGDEN
jgi:hypothetical protein